MTPSSKSSQKLEASLPVATKVWEFEAIGTRWWIGIYQPLPAHFADVQLAVAKRIAAFDQTYSRFRADSLVSRIAEQAGTYRLPPDSRKLLQCYRQLYDCTDGLVTPLIGQALADAGYDASYSLRPTGHLQSPPAWDAVLRYHSNVLTTTAPVLLDLGAAGKGYVVDIVAGLLRRRGLKCFCIDAGGDMYCQGLAVPLRIGLEHPQDATQAVGVARLRQGALCGSAGNRRAWGQYHHILNPRTLRSPRHIQAVWVQTDTAMVADGLATALFFVPPAMLQRSFQFECVIIYADGTAVRSAGFPAELFTTNLSEDS